MLLGKAGKAIVFAVLVSLCLLLSTVQAFGCCITTTQLEWSKTYSRPPATTPDNLTITHIDGGYRFVQTSDGGYAIVGNIMDSFYRGQHSGGNSNYSATIIKTNSAGNLQWQKIDSKLMESKAIFQTKDSGYIIFTRSRFLMTDAQGTIQSNKGAWEL